ncbi:MAG: hypothetical protein JWN56_931 [Sphingobacteriales bacterium]|nr:hypothetical protein [Sphingobacteriales bacterium]
MTLNPFFEIIIRVICVYLFMVFAIRIFGKKELSQLSTTDLVFIVLISNAVQNAMVGSDSSLKGGLIAASVLFILNFALKLLMYRSSEIKDLIEDKPVILVHDGKVDIEHMHSIRMTLEELEEAVREHGVESYKEVKLAILEVDGNVSVISGNDDRLKQTHHKYRRRHKTLTRSA